MTLQQCLEVSLLARANGYATRAKNGKVQFVTVEYSISGKSIVNPVTDWLNYAEARDYAEASLLACACGIPLSTVRGA